MIDKIEFLETKEEKFPLIFTLNVMEAIQDKYGSIDEWSKLIQKQGEPDIKALKFFITEAINEGIDIENEKTGDKRKLITTRKAGRILTEIGLAEATKKVTGTITNSVRTDNKNPNDQTMRNQEVK